MTDTSRHPHLLAPLRVAGVTLPNRMVMGAMHTRLETLDRPTERLAAFYAERARGEIGLILTGGHSPVPEGVMDEGGLVLNRPEQLAEHRHITEAVRAAGSHIVLQILHAGRYAKVPDCVAPSALKARINRFTPRALSTDEVWDTIAAFARSAELAEQAGYAGVEIMGSEGYLINEFTSALTNQRQDAFGGDAERRLRLPVEVLKAARARVGPGFMLIYRISAIDLMDGGMTGAEVATLARAAEAAGADVINTGIGWHEAGVPTIAAAVPRAAWVAAVRNVKQAVRIPVMASNRINLPDVAESLLASGAADLVSMARPLLADADFARKTRQGRADEINPCIACNQACLDHIFTERVASCLVNPRAGRELDWARSPAAAPRRVAVVGGGPAGMAFALNAAERGHAVTLYEAEAELGGQLNMARQVPGKSEFNEMLRYFRGALARAGVRLRLGTRASAEQLAREGFEHVVLATGITPRRPAIPGLDHPRVASYIDVIERRHPVGRKVALIGAGGIGFDVAELLTHSGGQADPVHAYQQEWGIDPAYTGNRGGLTEPGLPAAPREVWLLQRKSGKLGAGLAKTTGWARSLLLKKRGVHMLGGVEYIGIDDAGLHIQVDGQQRCLEVDTVVICAGQEPRRELQPALEAAGIPHTLVGGAHVAAELDAKRAILEATEFARHF
ncbi:MAG: NADPH-dependent 2,4-dienoyl-CoA reductase [Proteobacteria bacterium]|nr:NADPH-dependent 2,4-dienoyl-CoA reductase [Pseudomonadota bacterium]